MAIVAGQATVRTSTTAVTNAHNARASTGTAAPGTASGSGTDQAFELDAGASITVNSAIDIAAIGGPVAGDIKMWVEFVADNVTAGLGVGTIRSVETLSNNPAVVGNTNGTAVTFFATSDGTSGGTPIAGTFRLRVRMEYGQVLPDATVGNYKADSDGIANYSESGTPNLWDFAEAHKGYLRSGADISAVAVSNTLGGSVPSPFAWPDSLRLRATSDVVALTSSSVLTFVAQSLNVATAVRTFTMTASTSSTSWDSSSDPHLDTTDPTTFGALIGPPANSTLTGRPWTHFTTIPGGWTSRATDGTKTTKFDNRDAYTYSSAITFNTRALTLNGSGVSLGTVTNFGLRTIGGTFKLQNARAEVLTSALTAGDATVAVFSRDVVANSDQRELTKADGSGTRVALEPSAAGVYTLASNIHYRGPTSTANRGTGLDSDTAAHDTTGKTKKLKVLLTATNGPSANDSVTFVGLSDLLRLHAHVQRNGTTLNKDSDPYTPTTDQTSLVISADLVEQWTFVGDVLGVGVNAVACEQNILKPNGSQAQTDSSQSSDSTGWTVTASEFAAASPAGNWTARSRVELTNTGASGNYGDGSGSPFGHKDATIGFTSAFTANSALSLTLSFPTPVPPSVPVILTVGYRQGATVNTLDAAPNIRVYSVNTSTGAEVDDLALGAMTNISPSQYWKRTWTPSVIGNYIVEVRAVFNGADLEGTWPISVNTVGGLVCQARSTANVTSLSGTQAIDGVEVVVGNKVLLTNQTTASQNGAYTVATNAWTAITTNIGDLITISTGNSEAESVFMVTSSSPTFVAKRLMSAFR